MPQRYDSLVMDTDFQTIYSVDSTYKMPRFHLHNVFEIYFSPKGGVHYFVENKSYLLEKNDILLFNNLDLHRVVVPPGTEYERYVTVFDPSFIGSMGTSRTNLLECFVNRQPDFCHHRQLELRQAAEFGELLERGLRCSSSLEYGADVRKKIVLCEMLLFVNKLYKDRTASSAKKIFAEENVLIKQVLEYMNQNITQKLSIEALSGRFYLSRSHLCKQFKRTTGFTINEYILYRRVLNAAELLKKRLTVTQVSEQTGFLNPCHFITTFKKITGITPKQYEKTHKLRL